MRRWLLFAIILVAAVVPTSPAATAQSDAGALDQLMSFALQRPSIAGPLRGELPVGLGAIHLQSARVEVRDFFVRATFSNPVPTGEYPWDIGFSFRRVGGDDGLKLIIDSDGTWSFKEGMQPILASGPIRSLATDAGASNLIDLVAVGSEAYFAVNGEYVATLDLSSREVSGDIAVGTAYFAKNQRGGVSAPYEGFEIWSLDRAAQAPVTAQNAEVLQTLMTDATASAGDAGPFSGELLLEEDTIDYSPANVHLRDFYAHVEFTNPYPASEHPWDIGIGFRDHGVGMAWRLAISSDGEWFLSQGTDPFRVSGQGAQVDTEEGGHNQLDLVVNGDTGYLAVNGDYVAALDLSASEARGDIWVSSGFFEENTWAGATTRYADFRVWSLEASASSGEPVEVVVWGNGEVIFDLPPENESQISGLASVVANGNEITVEVGVVGTLEGGQIGVYTGTCSNLEPKPLFELEPLVPETMSSVTTLDVDFDELTSSEHAIAIRAGAEEGNAVLACNEIPTRDQG